MKPTDLMRQMWGLWALLFTYSRSGTTFMAMFLPHLLSEMRDHLIAKDFKDCIVYTHGGIR
jgi:hypothetical protein